MDIKVDVPEGVDGDWAVEKFNITKQQAIFGIMAYGCRAPSAGNYTKLTYKGRVIMSDTPAEISDHWPVIVEAKGNVLINGLGLGMVVQACLDKTEVDTVTVVEVEEAVIRLTGAHYQNRYGTRLNIVHGDAYDWVPPKGIRYDVVWHDIWPDICADNYEQMKILHRKYGRRSVWQGSWCKDICRRQKLEWDKEKKRNPYIGRKIL